MSTTTNAQLSVVQRVEEIDAFAESHNLAVLTEGKGRFAAAIAVADAITQLKSMLTKEVMQPIMALQGTKLGFRTDKDKDGGYSMEVVRDCFIESTLKGFKMVGNQSNIIAGGFYPTKEGFEDFFLRLGRTGKFTDFRDSYSVPKALGDEFLVIASATWVYQGKPDKFEKVEIPIRANKGQGSDAILGKAKRKLLAKIYSRITGTVITDGDVSDAIDVETSPGGEKGRASGAGPGTTPGGAVEMPDEEVLVQLDDMLAGNEDKANAFLVEQGAIAKGQTYRSVSLKWARRILKQANSFIEAIGGSVLAAKH